MRLMIVPIEKLVPDPDVQYDWTYDPKRAAHIGANWNYDKCGVLCGVEGPDFANDGVVQVWIGRHRLAGAKIAGVKELRVDVWPSLTVKEKFAIKLAYDRDRRTVRRVETFLNEVSAGEPDAVAINRIVREYGWTIGRCGGTKQWKVIEAVNTLSVIYRYGPDHLRRVLELNTLWFGDPKTNSAPWLGGLSFAVRAGWVDRITPSGYENLRGVVPAVVIRQAVGEQALSGATKTGSAEGFGLGPLIAEALRRVARVLKAKGKEGGHE